MKRGLRLELRLRRQRRRHPPPLPLRLQLLERLELRTAPTGWMRTTCHHAAGPIGRTCHALRLWIGAQAEAGKVG